MEIDLQYLLFLQGIRISTGGVFDEFFNALSKFAVDILPFLPFIVFWSVNKKWGYRFLFTYFISDLVNGIVKLTVCAYRPWIRDPRIIPAGDAITTATGYSFPSGHTITATPIYGGIALNTWKKMKWLSIICLALIAVTGISRNYLGVHTPQDVVVAMIEGFVFLFAMHKLSGYLEKHPEKENIFLIAGVILGIIAICYITFKSYPMDYVNGELLVDPKKMMKDGYGDIGFFIAFCVGRFIEKTWIRFEPKLETKTISAGMAGGLILFFLIKLLGSPLKQYLGLQWGSFANTLFSCSSSWPYGPQS